ncbi:hypothetical protein BDR22DRAFT_842887 [Usnea florida]
MRLVGVLGLWYVVDTHASGLAYVKDSATHPLPRYEYLPTQKSKPSLTLYHPSLSHSFQYLETLVNQPLLPSLLW